MKVCDVPRTAFYDVIRKSFDALKVEPIALEIGVLRGDNAKIINEKLNPKKFSLVDEWSTSCIKEYKLLNRNRHWISSSDDYSEYYGGSLNEQSTFDKLYEETCKKFSNEKNVKIIKSDSLEAYKIFEQEKIGTIIQKQLKFDFIYLDANHTFEKVFDELMMYENLLPDLSNPHTNFFSTQ